MWTEPVAAVVGGSVAVAVLSIVMIGFSFRHGIIDDTLLFPVTMLSATMLLSLSAVLTDGSGLVLLPVTVAAVLVDVGCTLLYFQELVQS